MQMFNSFQTSKLATYLIALALTCIVGCGIKNKDLKRLGAVIVIGVAAKLIYDMVIEHKSKQINDEEQVADKYKKQFKTLPSEPLLFAYESSIKPGEVVSAGSDIAIVSLLEVVPSASTRQVKIEEQITIYDNEDNSKELKSFTKVVNQNTNSAGSFENEFTFKLPKGMPQGIYPVKTTVLLNGKASAPVNAEMQLVMNHQGEVFYELAAR